MRTGYDPPSTAGPGPRAQRRSGVIAVGALLLAGAILGGFVLLRRGAGQRDAIRWVVPPCLRDSGLVDALLDAARAEGLDAVQVTVLGPAEAMRAAERGEVDLVILDSARAEERLRSEGLVAARADVWWERFVVVGPVEGDYWERNYVAEMSRHWPDATFSKPYVGSLDTFLAESPVEWDRTAQELGDLRDTGGTQYRDARASYRITDEATWLRTRKPSEQVLVLAEAPDLVDGYGAVRVRSARGAATSAGASRLLAWLTGASCRRVVRSHTVAGQRAYFAPAERPEGLPFGRVDRPFAPAAETKVPR